jgi:hypothetical protein
MSRRRGGVAVPLVTLVVSFLVVLALGAWLRTSQSDSSSAVSGSPSAVSFEIKSINSRTGFEIKSLTGSDGKEQKLPAGLRVTVSAQDLEIRGGSEQPTVNVKICVGPGPRWTPQGEGWMQPDGDQMSCRMAPIAKGKTDIDPLHVQVSYK